MCFHVLRVETQWIFSGCVRVKTSSAKTLMSFQCVGNISSVCVSHKHSLSHCVHHNNYKPDALKCLDNSDLILIFMPRKDSNGLTVVSTYNS